MKPLTLLIIFWGIILILTASCKKKEYANMPVVSTVPVTNIAATTATCGGIIVSDGEGTITANGVCWSTETNPTLANGTTKDRTDSSIFISHIFGLKPVTTYYVRAYATNIAGTAYGDQQTFTTGEVPIVFNPDLTYDSVADFDGNSYRTIQIGTQVWMAENLKTTHYADGTVIPLVKVHEGWRLLTYNSKAYCWYNDNIAAKMYGAFYTWSAAMNGADSSSSSPSGVLGVCPTGWHVPSKNEWEILINYLGGSEVAGMKMKEIGTIHWNSDSNGVTNESGFTLLPGGWISNFGDAVSIGYMAAGWSTTETDSPFQHCWAVKINSFNSIEVTGWEKNFGFSVRCIKD